MNRLFLFCITFIILFFCDTLLISAETSQYYDESTGQMEIPIFSGDNYVSFCSLENTNISVFNSINPVNLDKVYRIVDGNEVYAQYNGTGWDNADNVEPIEAGIGYNYNRKPAGGNSILVYECDFKCNNTGEIEVIVNNGIDIILFLFFIFVALFLSFISYFISGGIGLGLAWLGGAMMILTAIKIGTGEAITIVSNGSVVTLDIGLDRSHIFILFILFAILIIVSNSYIALVGGTK